MIIKISICCSCYAWILCVPRLPEVTAALVIVFCICLVKGVNAQDSRARAMHLVAGVVGAAELWLPRAMVEQEGD
jgi:hypothetical protein